ncbi:MAG: (d)CMP kinase [Bacilli bacterium]|nr:(d)CMP kinase [Erysipelotrichaceae bacterium]MDY4819696.1 (d)CMP kinase [Bacilli bacterium]
MKRVVVAIDGPAAAGKSTISKLVAKSLGFTYIDTGAMYRAFTSYVIDKGVDPKNEKECVKLIPEVDIVLYPDGKVMCSGKDVTRVIREQKVSSNVSYIASYKDIRLALVELQRKMAESQSVVMDGRDIGTYVLPNADVKIFMVASVKERADRRFKENMEKGIPCTYEEIVEDVEKRDRIDSSRAFAPLKPAEDSILLDTSLLSIEQVHAAVLKIIKDKVGEF